MRVIMTKNVLSYLYTKLNLSNFHSCPFMLLFCQIIKNLKTFKCNVTEVYNVKYLFFLRRKNKTMIKTLHLCISYLCINSKIIDRAKIHRRLENKIT